LEINNKIRGFASYLAERTERRYSPFEYLPFGGGVRRSIRMAFAQFEM